jgi:DNA (cytosine-5)-methyltransferase 1
MTIGSLFAGIGGLERGLEEAGLGPVLWQVESDPHCQKVLERWWPEAERYPDVKEFSPTQARPVDLICGGFPCQDVSVAGRGAGLAGARSGLWYEFARIVEEGRPRWVVVENVASGASRWLDAVRGDLERIGYATFPVPIAASDLGAPHRRSRIFVLGCLADSGGFDLRQQRGGRGGPSREDSAQPGVNGQERDVANADGLRQLQQEGATGDERRRVADSGWWSAEPDVDRVAHGTPRRSQRLRALGNAVVPQCAEVVGWIIRELEAP